MRVTWRGAEFSLLLPILLLVPFGFIVTHVALAGSFEVGDLSLALIYVALFASAVSLYTSPSPRDPKTSRMPSSA